MEISQSWPKMFKHPYAWGSKRGGDASIGGGALIGEFTVWLYYRLCRDPSFTAFGTQPSRSKELGLTCLRYRPKHGTQPFLLSAELSLTDSKGSGQHFSLKIQYAFYNCICPSFQIEKPGDKCCIESCKHFLTGQIWMPNMIDNLSVKSVFNN